MTIAQMAEKTLAAYQAFLKTGDTRIKNEVLLTAADLLDHDRIDILHENKRDVQHAVSQKISEAMLDRLTLNDTRINGMIQACRDIAALEDPVGAMEKMVMRPQGFHVGRMRVPIGVIAIIYEARPNVTVEAAALCLKSGNGVILRGGSGAYHTNQALIRIMKEALLKHGVDEHLISCVHSKERDAVDELLKQEASVHLVIPRGGESLIRRVVEHSRIPVLKHYKGVCHLYVHSHADLHMAADLTINAKVQRPGVCNALETLLVDASVAETYLPAAVQQLKAHGVEMRGCEKTRAVVKHMPPATDDDWGAEYLNLTLAIKIVNGLEEAIHHINRWGSGHTDAIVTQKMDAAGDFIRRVDSASVMVNASPRLADGGVYGLGAEIGISTDRLHARGPMGLEELTTRKWVVMGNGHCRE